MQKAGRILNVMFRTAGLPTDSHEYEAADIADS
jgi:hypothetical protein